MVRQPVGQKLFNLTGDPLSALVEVELEPLDLLQQLPVLGLMLRKLGVACLSQQALFVRKMFLSAASLLARLVLPTPIGPSITM